MSLPALYELVNHKREFERLAEFDELPAELIRDTLESLDGSIEAKAISVAKFCRNLETTADTIEEAAKAMQQRAGYVRNRANAIKAYLLFQMQAASVSKVECPEFTLAVRNNPEAVRIAEGVEVPAEFMVQPEPPPPRPDKAKLKAALKAGAQIDGCWLESGQRIEIKT